MADSVSVTSASDDEQQSSQSQSLKRVKRMPRKDEMRVFLRIRPSEPNEIRGRERYSSHNKLCVLEKER